MINSNSLNAINSQNPGSGNENSHNTSPLGVGGIKNPKHRAFIRHYLRLGNITEAYLRAYPDSSRSTAATNGSKLCGDPLIKAEIERRQTRLEEEAMEIAETEIRTDLAAHYVSIHEKRLLLTDMMRGRHKVNRYFKMKDEIKILEDNLPPQSLLRAIDMDTRLENGWYDRKPLPLMKEQKQKAEQPLPMPTDNFIFIGNTCFDNKAPVLTDEELTALWQLSLTHDNIITPMPVLGEKYKYDVKLTKCPNTGRWVSDCSQELIEAMKNDRGSLVNISSGNSESMDCSRIAEIIKSNNIISRACNREICVVLYGGSNIKKEIRSEEPNTDTPPPADTPPPPDDNTQPACLQEAPLIDVTGSLLNDKNEYRPVLEICREYRKVYAGQVNPATYKDYKELVAVYKGSKYPPHLRKNIELQSSWQYHPENPSLIHKKSA